MFFHETRERFGDYDPTTEKDITKSGIFELSREEWKNAFRLLEDGMVSRKKEDKGTGSSGPWTYIYLNNNRNELQEYTFSSFAARQNFENFCLKMVEKEQKLKNKRK